MPSYVRCMLLTRKDPEGAIVDLLQAAIVELADAIGQFRVRLSLVARCLAVLSDAPRQLFANDPQLLVAARDEVDYLQREVERFASLDQALREALQQFCD